MFEAYDMSHQQKDPGEAMTDQRVKTAVYPHSHHCSPRYPRLVEAFRDALMVSSFGFWALLLGFMPVMAFCMLRGG
jgi:uncharacterized membrane protein YccC